MIIQKTYKFYAAHRNEELFDKCRNIHGHRYRIRCFFRVKRTGSISTLFGDFDERIEPFLKREYDHAMLINTDDPLYDALNVYLRDSGDTLKLKRFDEPTSVENLANKLIWGDLRNGFRTGEAGDPRYRQQHGCLHPPRLAGRAGPARRRGGRSAGIGLTLSTEASST